MSEVKTAIFYISAHHGNTRKLLLHLQEKTDNVSLFKLPLSEAAGQLIEEYDFIGLASGIYHGDFHRQVYKFLAQLKNLSGKNVFAVFTSGTGKKEYINNLKAELEKQKVNFCGFYQSRGFDTYGILKFIGGIAKGHPNERDLAGIEVFYQSLLEKNNAQLV